MTPKLFLDGKVKLYAGDCREVLADLEENSIDSCVTDPPYHLTSIVKRFGSENAAPAKSGKTGAYARASRGFMGKVWDGGDVAFDPATWELVLRVLKPGAHLLALGGTRTYHSLAHAIEQAGFEIRDAIMWHYGSGFPKSHDISKAIDRMAGAEREVISTTKYRDIRNGHGRAYGEGIHASSREGPEYLELAKTAPATDAAKEWQGWGTALKPSTEIICLARKPLSEASIAANVLKHGTGAINVDGCRVPVSPGDRTEYGVSGDEGKPSANAICYGDRERVAYARPPQGRWPANLIHDGSEEVLERFPETTSGEPGTRRLPHSGGERIRQLRNAPLNGGRECGFGDSGSAARFFYTAKADADDRLGSKHPTVKPVDLIQYLVRLVTPRNGLILDPFAGTGTTGEAAFREACNAILIEREPEYLSDIERRMSLTLSGPDERRAASVKQLPPDDLPMFSRGAA